MVDIPSHCFAPAKPNRITLTDVSDLPHTASGPEDSRTRWIGADSILFATQHRPWPAPMTPWVMTQRWNDLLFLHYAIPAEKLRPLVPEVLALDTYEHTGWVSITPFWINHLRPPGVPSLPWVSHFAEINVRTYVTYEGKPGVYFFSLDASHLSAVWGARIFYRLPYWHASMKVRGRGKPKLQFQSKRSHGPKPAELRISYGPIAPGVPARRGSLEHFLTERYCLYSVNRERMYRADIHHLPWSLEPVEVELALNTMAQTAGIDLRASPDLTHFSRSLKVLVWAPERLM